MIRSRDRIEVVNESCEVAKSRGDVLAYIVVVSLYTTSSSTKHVWFAVAGCGDSQEPKLVDEVGRGCGKNGPRIPSIGTTLLRRHDMYWVHE